ncbi:diglucosylglycerate octanoyltransferase [Nocardia sp. NPDC059177]|uniref:diglucosylglycerate octanoyltransferase n=1 Tax=Nocardia sp. NPDC059177 TaxID=3346759 RepID=UPI0036AC153D
MSSEEPVRSVPDELFQQVTAKPGRQLPDALFGPPPARPTRPEREEPIRSVPDELFKQVTARSTRSLPDALFGPPPAPVVAEPEQSEAAGSGAETGDAAAVDESDGVDGSSSSAASHDVSTTVGSSAEVAVSQVAEADGVDAEGADGSDSVAAHSATASAASEDSTGVGQGADDESAIAAAALALPSPAATIDTASTSDASDARVADVEAASVEAAVTTDSAPTDKNSSAGAAPAEVAAGAGVSGVGVAAETTVDKGVVDEAGAVVGSGAVVEVAEGVADAGGSGSAAADVGTPLGAGAAAGALVEGGIGSEAVDAVPGSATADANSVDNLVAAPVAGAETVPEQVVPQAESVVATADGAGLVEPAAAELPETQVAPRPVLLVIADSLSYYGPKGGLPADDPRIWPNLVAAELDWDVELIARIGWTCRDAYWALIGDPRVWASVPRAGAVVFAVGGMDTLPSPLPTALRELIRYIRPPRLRRGVRATYNWLQPKLSKLGRPVALPPRVSVDYLEQSREALEHLRPELPVVAVLPSVHRCDAYGRVHRGRPKAVKALLAWSSRTKVPLVDLGEAVREDIDSGSANPDGIHWGWAGHTAVATAMTKTLQEVR